MTPLEIVLYYSNLLILQYLGKPKAYATVTSIVAPVVMPQVSVQVIAFSAVSASGAFELTYDDQTTASIHWNDSASTIQSALRALSGLGSVTVSGSIASQSLAVTFTGVIAPASLLTVSANTLLDSGSQGVAITVTETDQTLPVAVQNAFNVIGSSTAIGVQLDILGKYAGVVRTGNGPYGYITLSDADFLTLIQFALIQNNAGSSLADIDKLLVGFFPGTALVVDYQNMQLGYILSSSLGTSNLFILLVLQNLLPKPMGVSASLVVVPVPADLFGFRTYDLPNNNVKPFNNYDSFNTTWLWLKYDYAVIV